jgi:hypothetical protein
MGHEAFPPPADGVSVTAQFGGENLVGWVVRRSGPQDQAATKDERLGSGAGAQQGFELAAQFRDQFDGGGKGARHGSPPGSQDKAISCRGIMAIDASLG